MKYFAYGSNMCTNRLRDRVPSCKFDCIAVLKEHTIRFHKRSTEDGSGKCNAFYTGKPEDEVIGVLYDIAESEKPLLDKAEGLGKGYLEKYVDVTTPSGVVNALMYVARSGYIEESLAPFTWYKEFVVEGAREHQLPGFYIEKLEAVKATDDPDKERDAKERKTALSGFLRCNPYFGVLL